MELLEELKKYNPDDTAVSIEAVDLKAEVPSIVVYIKFGIYLDEEDVVEQRWKVSLKGLKEVVISDRTSNNIEVEEAHSLLWEEQDAYAQLYFNGVPTEVYQLYFELAEVHNKLFEN